MSGDINIPLKEELKQHEIKLKELAVKDKKNWINFYLELKEIETKELWKLAGYRSFTAWVKEFAQSAKIHESIIWSRKKAGEVYNRYKNIKINKNEQVSELKDTNINSESLVLIEKIAKKNDEVFEDLTNKVLKNELKKTDLQKAYKLTKNKELEQKERKKELTEALENIKDKASRESIKDELDSLENHYNKDITTALDITNALTNYSWLTDEKITKKAYANFYEQKKYRTFTEIAVHTATTRKARRIDVLAIENITNIDSLLNLHGIEIKVSKHDLLKDHKYTEYALYVDYLWLAIPPELTEVAKETKSKNCGILVYEDNKIKVLEKADRLDGERRQEVLELIALRLI